MAVKPLYRRVLLKVSGEALMGEQPYGIDPTVIDRIAADVLTVRNLGVEVALVVGGGNIFRGVSGAADGIERATADYMGMLATVMNALAMRDALERANIQTVVMSAIPMSGVVEHYDRRLAIRHLEEGDVVIFSSGTGNPFFTTDSAACLRGIEVDADIVLKATKVDGIYSSDPVTNPSATRFTTVTYDEILEQQLGVMDLTAICLARDNGMPLRVFQLDKQDALLNAVVGEGEGTLVVPKKAEEMAE